MSGKEPCVFKGLANLPSLMRSAQQMGGKMQELNQRLRRERVTASVAAGMVEVEANGVGEILRLTIDPQLLERGELEMLEDLVPAAVNEALAKAKQLHVDAMKEMTEGIDLPGLTQALEQFAGGGEQS
ncbi:MAG: YbaB/EbfC family nucleoid-associated protein [Planctomycetes bacterium]|nr:YbaB/EbfC family nucleoid-associated protein [Planctomycetota bacterium]